MRKFIRFPAPAPATPRFMITAVATMVFALTGLSRTAMADEPVQSPAEKYAALIDEFEEVGGARQFAERFFELADAHPKDPVAVDSLLWIVKNLRTRPDAKRALELLTERHLDSERLVPGFRQIARTPTVAAEKLLRACMERSPHRTIQAEACFQLTLLLEEQAEVVEQMKQQPELTNRIIEYSGKDYGAYLASLDKDQLNRQIERNCDLMKDSFADVTVQGSTLGAYAERTLFRFQHLSVGTVAPDITGEDIDGKSFKLSDYRGKVVMLNFWGHW